MADRSFILALKSSNLYTRFTAGNHTETISRCLEPFCAAQRRSLLCIGVRSRQLSNPWHLRRYLPTLIVKVRCRQQSSERVPSDSFP
jgi:hypothetical protein